jgi:prepilin-type N-terminal cleavage/methylation domain-containing protein
MHHKSRGFTILELMVAISVFSVAIILVTTGAILVGRYYQQGATKSKLLATTREIHSQFTQNVQLSAGSSVYIGGISDQVSWNSTNYYYNCIGNTRYLLSTIENTSDEYYGDFMTEDISNKSCKSTLVENPIHPLPSGSRAAKSDNTEAFAITEINRTYKLQTRFVIGSQDMFVDDDYKNTCQSNVLGSAFCSVVSLDSEAARKVIN